MSEGILQLGFAEDIVKNSYHLICAHIGGLLGELLVIINYGCIYALKANEQLFKFVVGCGS